MPLTKLSPWHTRIKIKYTLIFSLKNAMKSKPIFLNTEEILQEEWKMEGQVPEKSLHLHVKANFCA